MRIAASLALLAACSRVQTAPTDPDPVVDPDTDADTDPDTDPPTCRFTSQPAETPPPPFSDTCGSAVGGAFAAEGCAVAIIDGSVEDQMLHTDPAVGDLNGDGIPDLAIAAGSSDDEGAVFLFYGPIAGQMRMADADVVISGSMPQYIAIADFDGNGQDDLAIGAEDVWVLPHPVTSSLSLSSVPPVFVLDGKIGLLDAADLDGDGAAEILAGSQFGNIPGGFLIRNPLGVPEITGIPGCPWAFPFAALDWDCDGQGDLACSDIDRVRIELGPFEPGVRIGGPAVELTAPPGGQIWGVETMDDTTGDGVQDLLLSLANGSPDLLYGILAGGTPEGVLSIDANAVTEATHFRAGDFDGDGRGDVTVPGATGTGIAMRLGPLDLGSPSAPDAVIRLDPSQTGAEMHAVDLDGDGADELFLTYEWKDVPGVPGGGQIVVFPSGSATP
ncbi:MAG: VCBS repeat-containing protein [Alphaproteobacteria bacterium]|nr:VCBS repeat-containing protein [Alphaproteobacteria bacterium]